MNVKTATSFGVSLAARLPLFLIAVFLLIVSAGTSHPAHAAAFEQTEENIENSHYIMCKNKLGPQLTRDQAKKLDAYCQEIVQKSLSPEEIEREKDFINKHVKKLQ
ncbi:hypothetical protein [Pseudomonas kitaguniensis]|uniref:hypothetical protein n=1 Tax=Pseudomonas kitaguniensis TaxID=2607908 RepID=UPI003B9E4C0C